MPRDPLAFLQRQQQRQPRRDPIAFLRRQAPPLTPMRAPQVPPGTLEDLQIGAARGYLGLTAPIEAAGDIVAGALTGDFQPLKETGKRLALGAASYIAPPGSAPAFNAAIEEARAQREQRQFNQGNIPAIRRAAQEAQLAKLEAKDPSLAGRLTRGAVSTAIQSAPYLAAAPAGIPALAATGAAMSLGEPENIPLSAGLAATPLPIGQAFRAGINAVRRMFGKGAAQIIEAEALPAATAQVRQSIGEAIPAPVATPPAAESLQSAFAKLGTDNVDEIAEMIANANRRLNATRTVPGGTKTPITKEERLSSWEDYNKLRQITADEHRALSQILPPRNYEPVGIFEKGKPSRNITDIPASEPNAQLDANLRELEQFFGGQSAARRIAAETGPPALSADMSISGATPSVRGTSAGAMGPGVGADLDAMTVAAGGAGTPRPPIADINAPWEPQWASQPLQQAIMEGVRGLPTPLMRRIKNEFLGTLGAFKSLKSTGDISYPFRQGAILMSRPFQWRQTQKMWREMFRGFKTKNFEAINKAIAGHPDAPLAKEAGLAIDVIEEAFPRRAGSRISEAAGKLPGVKHANQAYTTAANVQRFEEFLQYKRLFDKAGLSPEETMKGYKAAAQWINISTGRGSLGQTIDRAFEALNYTLFSPRFVASRLNVFNPVMYARNASSPGGRVVLKRQMADLAQFAGVVATTLYLAQQAGADVTLNPKSPDFFKIRLGRWRYDMGAGLTQVMRAGYRIGADLARAGRGEKPKYRESAIDIAERFLSYKLSPPAAVFRNFVYQRTPEGRPFTAGRAVADLVAPMQWADFVDAWVQEGLGGAAMTLPGVPGIGTQLYEPNPVNDAIEKTRPLFAELRRLDKRVTPVHRRENEPDAVFNSRVQQFGQNYSRFGLQLVASPRFQTASDDLKNRALDQLNGRAKGITLREFAFPELELDAELLMDAAENAVEREAETKRQRGW